MAKKRNPFPPEAEMEVDLSPMIDMVFLLLIFFVVTANALQIPASNKAKVPEASASKAQSDKTGRIVVNITENGDFYDVEEQLLPDDEATKKYLKDQLNIPANAKLFNDPKQKTVVKLHLRGDLNSLYKHADKAMSLAAEVGIIQVAFATQKQ